MTRGDLKTSRTGSRTPFQLLADYYQIGDTRDRDLWREYCCVTRSLAAVRWSRGLRSAVGGSATDAERTDEELAAENVGGNQLAVLEFAVWARIRAAGLERAVLVAAEQGGLRAVTSLAGVTLRSLTEVADDHDGSAKIR
jgi:hypothetical protein